MKKYQLHTANAQGHKFSWISEHDWTEDGLNIEAIPKTDRYQKILLPSSLIIFIRRSMTKGSAESLRDDDARKYYSDFFEHISTLFERYLHDLHFEVKASLHFVPAGIVVNLQNYGDIKKCLKHVLKFVIDSLSDLEKISSFTTTASIVDGHASEVFLIHDDNSSENDKSHFLAKQVVGPGCDAAYEYARVADPSSIILRGIRTADNKPTVEIIEDILDGIKKREWEVRQMTVSDDSRLQNTNDSEPHSYLVLQRSSNPRQV